MKTFTLARFFELQEQPVTQGRAMKAGAPMKLDVKVIFTDFQGTLAALETAGLLARNLGACIELLAAYVVPYALPIDQPPVSVSFLQRGLLDLASRAAQEFAETRVHLCLCRDKRQALIKMLRPRSLVIIGGKERWRPTREESLARVLASNGHQVIFTERR